MNFDPFDFGGEDSLDSLITTEDNYNTETEVSEDTETEENSEDFRKVPEEELAELIDDTEEVEEEEEPCDWAIPLSSIDHSFELTEFDTMTYKWIRVKDPDGESTDKFTVFAKPVSGDDSEWEILNGLISKRYQIASLEKFVNNLSEDLDISGAPTVQFDKFKFGWNAVLDTNIEIFDSEEAKTVFAIITGIGIDTIDNIRTKASLFVMNSYDGKAKLNINYVLKTTANLNGERKHMDNYFVLNHYSHKVIHGSNLDNINANLDDLEDNANDIITQLKEYTLDDESTILNSVRQKFNSDGVRLFDGLWEGLVNEDRNMYWLTIIASLALNKNFNFQTYHSLNGIISRAVQSIISQ